MKNKNNNDFLKWAKDELLITNKYGAELYNALGNAKEYYIFNSIASMVMDIVHDKYKDKKEYHEKKPEVWRYTREIIAMTMFFMKRFYMPNRKDEI